MEIVVPKTWAAIFLLSVTTLSCRTAASVAEVSDAAQDAPAVVDRTSQVVFLGTSTEFDMLHFERIKLLVSGAKVADTSVRVTDQQLASCTLVGTSDSTSWMNVEVDFRPTPQEDGRNGCNIVLSRNGTETVVRLDQTSEFRPDHKLQCVAFAETSAETWPNVSIGLGNLQASKVTVNFPPQQAPRVLVYDKVTRDGQPFVLELSIEAQMHIHDKIPGLDDARFSFVSPTTMQRVTTTFVSDDPTRGIAGSQTVLVRSDNSISGFLSWSLVIRLPDGFQFEGHPINQVEAICSGVDASTNLEG